MSNLQSYEPFGPSARVGRALTRINSGTDVAVARLRAGAEIEAARIDGVASVAAKALHDVALLSQIEQSLALAVPHASGRLAAIADLAAVSMAGVVADSARRMGQ